MPAQLSVRLLAERLSTSRSLLAVVVALGGAWIWVTVETPVASRPLVAIAGGLTVALLCVAAAGAVYRTSQVRNLRNQVETMKAELTRLVDEMLPAAVQKVLQGKSADTALAEIPRPANDIHYTLLRMLTSEIAMGERRRAAAMAACANAAGRVQALTTSMLADLREMEDRHAEAVLGDLLKLDHSTSQAGRLADSIAVLSGARSGRRWTKPIVMESILRGAMGRIGAYQRVQVHSTSTVAVAGYAAEDVMHALAELLDNATRFSAPSEEVHVYVEEFHAGVVITIEDGGLIMKPAALQRAERAVSASEPLDLASLSGTRLGLPVVGCLARKHQLKIFFRPSSRGGTGVVLRIPQQLITQPRLQPIAVQPSVGDAPLSIEAPSPEPADAVTAAEDDELALPQRRRGQTLAPSSSAGRTARPGARTRVAAGARFGAFRHGSQGGAPQDGPFPPAEDETR